MRARPCRLLKPALFCARGLPYPPPWCCAHRQFSDLSPRRFFIFSPCLLYVVATKQGGETPPPGYLAHLGVLLILFCTGLEILEKRIRRPRDPVKGGERNRPPYIPPARDPYKKRG